MRGLRLGIGLGRGNTGEPPPPPEPTAPGQMDPPTLEPLSGTEIAATLAVPPSDGGSAITSYDMRYSTDESTWTDIIGADTTEIIDGLTPSTLYYVQNRAVNAVGNGAWSESEEAAALDLVTLSAYTENLAASPPTFGFSVSANGDGKTLFYEFHSEDTYPGRGNGDIASGNLGAISSGSNAPELDLSEYPGETGYVFFSVGDPGQSNIIPVTPNAVTIDARPVLTSPTDTANGATAATGSVSTNVGNGTLYWVVTTSATSPTRAQVEAGQNHTGAAAAASGSQAVSGTGVQTLSPAPSGLTASTTYYIHFMHKRASEVESLVSSADGFTTASGSSGVTKVDSLTVQATGTSTMATVDVSGLDIEEGDLVLVGLSRASNSARAMAVTGYTDLTGGGLLGNDVNDTTAYIYYKVQTSTPDTSIVCTTSSVQSTSPVVIIVQVWRGVNGSTPFDVTTTTATGTNTRKPDPASITPTTSGAVIVVFGANAYANGDYPDALVASYLTSPNIREQTGTGGWATSALMGHVAWSSGAYNPAAMTSSTDSADDSWVAFTMALRPA